MKYIDAEKLIAEIKKKRKILISEYNELAEYEVWRSANDNKIKIYTINDILSLINSLQQEQPEVDLSEETLREEFYTIDRMCFDEGISGWSGWQREKLIARHFYELGRTRKVE